MFKMYEVLNSDDFSLFEIQDGTNRKVIVKNGTLYWCNENEVGDLVPIKKEILQASYTQIFRMPVKFEDVLNANRKNIVRCRIDSKHFQITEDDIIPFGFENSVKIYVNNGFIPLGDMLALIGTKTLDRDVVDVLDSIWYLENV